MHFSDEQLELWEHHWSERVVKYAVWLSGLVPFAEAAAILNTIGEISISASSVWRRVAVWGPKCQALEASQRAASLATPTRDELIPTETPDSPALGGGHGRGHGPHSGRRLERTAHRPTAAARRTWAKSVAFLPSNNNRPAINTRGKRLNWPMLWRIPM